MGKEYFSVKKRIAVLVAGWVNGWPSMDCQSGRSSLRVRGSMTAPERICEPTYKLRSINLERR